MDDSEYIRQIRQKAEAILAYRAGRLGGLIARLALAGAFLFLFYLARPVWAAWPRLHDILFERGPWPHVIILLAVLALTEMLLRLFDGWFAERFDLEQVELPTARQATSVDLLRLARYLETRAREWIPARHAVWTRRLALGLLQFARGDSKESIRSALQAQAEADDAALASRYTLVKLYLWAIPLLGFIGTVEGIGSGIGEFSSDLAAEQQVEQAAPDQPVGSDQAEAGGVTDRMSRVKTSLENVTSGLGRAFDTTYLALVVTVALMIAMSVIEKLETDRQLRFDEFCQTRFVGRLASEGAPGGGGEVSQAVSELQQSLKDVRQVSADLKGFKASADDLNRSLGKGIRCRLELDEESD